AAAFVTGHDDGNPGVALQRKIWRLAKRGLDGVKRILRLTVGGGQTEMPILHALAGVPPVIGETENDRPGKTGAEGGFDLPGEDFAFAVLAFAGGVDAKFAKEERLGISDHLQAREVILKSLALVQVDIEGNEIETVRPEEFRGGKICEGAEATGIRVFGFGDQFVNESGHGAGTAPANDVGGDFVGDAEGEHGGMAVAGTDRIANGGPSLIAQAGRIEKAEMLGPGDVHEHAQFVFRGEIQEPARGDIINAHEIGAELAYLGEVTGDLFARGKMGIGGIRGEGAVRDAFGKELPVADAKELSVHRGTGEGRQRRSHSKLDERPRRFTHRLVGLAERRKEFNRRWKGEGDVPEARTEMGDTLSTDIGNTFTTPIVV